MHNVHHVPSQYNSGVQTQINLGVGNGVVSQVHSLIDGIDGQQGAPAQQSINNGKGTPCNKATTALRQWRKNQHQHSPIVSQHQVLPQQSSDLQGHLSMRTTSTAGVPSACQLQQQTQPQGNVASVARVAPQMHYHQQQQQGSASASYPLGPHQQQLSSHPLAHHGNQVSSYHHHHPPSHQHGGLGGAPPVPVRYSEIVEGPTNAGMQMAGKNSSAKDHQVELMLGHHWSSAPWPPQHHVTGNEHMGYATHHHRGYSQSQGVPVSMGGAGRPSAPQPPPFSAETNTYLAKLHKINPRVAQSIIHDSLLDQSRLGFNPHVPYPPPPPMYSHQKPPNPYSSHSPYSPTNHPYSYPPQQKTQAPQAQQQQQPSPPVYKYPHEQPPSPLKHARAPSQYPEQPHPQYGVSMSNGVGGQRFLPQVSKQSYLEYSQHYQHRQSATHGTSRHYPPGYYPSRSHLGSMQANCHPYDSLSYSQRRIIENSNIGDDGNGKNMVGSQVNINLKTFLESWNDEDMGSDGALKAGKGTELYVLDSTDISNEAIGQYLHIQQFDKLPENIRGYFPTPEESPKLIGADEVITQVINTPDCVVQAKSVIVEGKCEGPKDYSRKNVECVELVQKTRAQLAQTEVMLQIKEVKGSGVSPSIIAVEEPHRTTEITAVVVNEDVHTCAVVPETVIVQTKEVTTKKTAVTPIAAVEIAAARAENKETAVSDTAEKITEEEMPKDEQKTDVAVEETTVKEVEVPAGENETANTSEQLAKECKEEAEETLEMKPKEEDASVECASEEVAIVAAAAVSENDSSDSSAAEALPCADEGSDTKAEEVQTTDSTVMEVDKTENAAEKLSADTEKPLEAEEDTIQVEQTQETTNEIVESPEETPETTHEIVESPEEMQETANEIVESPKETKVNREATIEVEVQTEEDFSSEKAKASPAPDTAEDTLAETTAADTIEDTLQIEKVQINNREVLKINQDSILLQIGDDMCLEIDVNSDGEKVITVKTCQGSWQLSELSSSSSEHRLVTCAAAETTGTAEEEDSAAAATQETLECTNIQDWVCEEEVGAEEVVVAADSEMIQENKIESSEIRISKSKKPPRGQQRQRYGVHLNKRALQQQQLHMKQKHRKQLHHRLKNKKIEAKQKSNEQAQRTVAAAVVEMEMPHLKKQVGIRRENEIDVEEFPPKLNVEFNKVVKIMLEKVDICGGKAEKTDSTHKNLNAAANTCVANEDDAKGDPNIDAPVLKTDQPNGIMEELDCAVEEKQSIVTVVPCADSERISCPKDNEEADKCNNNNISAVENMEKSPAPSPSAPDELPDSKLIELPSVYLLRLDEIIKLNAVDMMIGKKLKEIEEIELKSLAVHHVRCKRKRRAQAQNIVGGGVDSTREITSDLTTDEETNEAKLERIAAQTAERCAEEEGGTAKTNEHTANTVQTTLSCEGKRRLSLEEYNHRKRLDSQQNQRKHSQQMPCEASTLTNDLLDVKSISPRKQQPVQETIPLTLPKVRTKEEILRSSDNLRQLHEIRDIVRRFLNKECLSRAELLKVHEIIKFKSLLNNKKDDGDDVVEDTQMPQLLAAPVVLRKQRKRRRFRNLYSDDEESCDIAEPPAVQAELPQSAAAPPSQDTTPTKRNCNGSVRDPRLLYGKRSACGSAAPVPPAPPPPPPPHEQKRADIIPTIIIKKNGSAYSSSVKP